MSKCFLEMKVRVWFCYEHYPKTRGQVWSSWPGRTPALGRTLWLHTFLSCAEIWLLARAPRDWEKSSGCGRGWWAGVSSWKGEAPAGRTAVVQEGSSGWQSPREDVPSWPSSILKQPHGSHLGVAACGTTWAVTAGEIQGRGTEWSLIQAQKCNHALFIPPDKIYHKQI